MDAKSIYEELLKQGIPEKLVTWSNKADSIDILIQDYNEKIYKEALKFFKGYEGIRVDYTIDHETALWCDNISKYSSDEFIRSITDFYYTLKAKGLAYTESKESARKSIKEQFVGKGRGGYRKPNKEKYNFGTCLDSNDIKHDIIFDIHPEDFIVWVDNDNYLMWNIYSPSYLLKNLAESDLDDVLISNIVSLWEKLYNKYYR